MQIYLVGGAVRDALLGLAVHDKDFVVVGATTNDLLAQGFMQVGADFPVFLHPHSHHEYALARTERKNGTGYQGFSTHTQGVSLKDDLLRRDLTINALAMEVAGLFDDTPLTGQVIDYYGGLDDLNHKVLRHVSDAFCEDPLRILRTVRFLARYHDKGFGISPDTIALMQDMAQAGELSHLSRERLWAESAKAMLHGTGHHYWQTLQTLGILPHFLPELSQCWQDDLQFHQTIEHLKAVKHCSLAVQFAVLCSGYLLTDNTHLTPELIKATAHQLNTPKYPVCIANLLSQYHQLFEQKPNAQNVLRFIEKTKAHQGNTDTLIDTMTALCVIKEYNASYQDTMYQSLHQAIACYQSVSINDIDPTLTGRDIGEALLQLRLGKISTLINELFT